MEPSLRVFRYRVASELRLLLESVAGVVLVGAIYVMRLPSSDFFPTLIALPVALVVTIIALYLGRLTRFEKIELLLDRVVWTDLWRRTRELPLSEIRSIEEDRTFLFGTRYLVKGDRKRIRWFSRIEGHRLLLIHLRNALLAERDRVPLSDLPWPGRSQYRYRIVDEPWVMATWSLGLAAALITVTFWSVWLLPEALTVMLVFCFLVTLIANLFRRRVTVESGDIVLRTGSRERQRTPLGSLRSVTIDPLTDGASQATLDTDGGPLVITSSLVGYDEFVDSAQRIVAHRFAGWRP